MTAAAGMAGTWLAACGRAGAHATPQSANHVENVPFQLYFVGPPLDATAMRLIQGFVDKTFNAKHKGIRAIFQAPYNLQQVATDVVAGSSAPVVVASCCNDWNIILPFLEKLDPWLKKDNVNTNLWTAGQLARFQLPTGLYGLPEDAASEAYLYRQDILDQIGASYPAPDWTSADAQRLWTQCSGIVHGKRRYGATCPWGNAGVPEGLSAVVHGWNGAFSNAARTRCLLNDPGSIKCGEYWMDMVWSNVATVGDGWPNQGIFNGSVVFTQGAEPTILQAVLNLGSAVKWDFIPYPRFPARPVGVLHDNFYGMLASAKNKELAWELLKFAAIDSEWSRFYMKVALAPPALPHLLSEWITILRSTAPILKNKHLEYWTDPTLRGEGFYDFEFFHYLPTNANAVFNSIWPTIWTRKTSVHAGFTAIAKQINAIETAAPAQIKQQQSIAQAFPTRGPSAATVTPGL